MKEVHLMTHNSGAIIPWPQHPRPDFCRRDWQNLNGRWAFAFDDGDEGLARRWYEKPSFSLEILVPFCYQSKQSGIHDTKDHTVVWYSRTFVLEEALYGKRCRLHFGAVDYEAFVWVDGQFAGSHAGGYTPFSFDITEILKRTGEGGEHTLTLRAVDRPSPAQPRGKQSWIGEPFECWYTPVTGIWQTVYLEAEGAEAIRCVHITPDVSNGCAHAEITLDRPLKGAKLKAAVTCGDEAAFECEYTLDSREQFSLTFHLGRAGNLDGIRLWEPDHPYLYDVALTLTDPAGGRDTVHTYFGMRSIQVREGRIYLNGSALYQKLVLDQGYWPDTLLTPPDDQALKADIEWALKLGYNGARKHQKIELPRYYYWADKLGLLVWGEVPSAYQFCTMSRDALRRDLLEFVRRDFNHPSIIAWVPLNESWGVRWIATDRAMQRFADSLYALLKSADPARIASTNDGWEQPEGDLITIHDYTAYGRQLSRMYASREDAVNRAPMRVRSTLASGYQDGNRPILISEYGGIAMRKDAENGSWGYNGAVDTQDKFLLRFEDITKAFCALAYVQGYCYTQLTDVFQEVNGLLTMEREPKADVDKIKAVNDSVTGL